MVAFQYRFVRTIDDLIDADRIDRSEQYGRVFRWLVDRGRELERAQLLIIAGLVGLGMLVFVLMSTRRDWLVVASLVALVLLYRLVLSPRRARMRIRTQSPARETVRLSFGRNGVSMDSDNGGTVTRSWDEFTGATDTPRGVLLYFTKMTLLVPRRVFANDEERREFASYVKQFEPTDQPL